MAHSGARIAGIVPGVLLAAAAALLPGQGLRIGMRVPSAGEVAWILPEGPLPYWRGRVKSVACTFAAPRP